MAYVLEEFSSRLKKFERDRNRFKIKCFVSSSVVEECGKLLDDFIDFLQKIITDFRTVLTARKMRKKGFLPLEKSDILFTESFFADKYRKIFGVRHDPRRNAKIRRLRELEELVVVLMEEEVGKSLTSVEFLKKMVSKFLETVNTFRNRFETFIYQKNLAEEMPIPPKEEVIQKLKELGVFGMDAVHLASAYHYQEKENNKVVFVSFDYTHIVNKSKEIYRSIRLRCTDPLYAIHYL